MDFNNKLKKITQVLLIDSSGSMDNRVDEVRSTIKEMIQDSQKSLQENPSEFTFIVIAFNSEIHVSLYTDSIGSVKAEHIANTYCPHGSTALYDSMMKAIDIVPRRQDAVQITIVTDGLENYSKTTWKELEARLDRRKEEGWEIVFVGCSDDIRVNHQKMALASHASMYYKNDDWAQMSADTREIRTAFYNGSVPNAFQQPNQASE